MVWDLKFPCDLPLKDIDKKVKLLKILLCNKSLGFAKRPWEKKTGYGQFTGCCVTPL
jgi:hypothetical protein